MYARTGDPAFLQYAFDWQRYKWPPIAADVYQDGITPEHFVMALPDTHRWLVQPATAQAFILDLRDVQPVRSFSYSMIGPYPADYSVDVSQDGITWQTVQTVTDFGQRHATLELNQPAVRYIRLSLGELIRDNPYYEQLSDGAYTDHLLVGVMRADSSAYWDEPVLLVTDGKTNYDDAQYLRDGDPQTTLVLPAAAVLYADLRTARQATGLQVEAAPDGEPALRRMWAETSADGQKWTPLIDREAAVEVTLPVGIELPQAAAPYRYLRLYLEGDSPLTMTEARIVMASTPPPAP